MSPPTHPAAASGRDSPPPSEQNPNQGRQPPSTGKFSDSTAQRTQSQSTGEEVSAQKGGIGKLDSTTSRESGSNPQQTSTSGVEKLQSNPKGPLDQYVEGKTKTAGL